MHQCKFDGLLQKISGMYQVYYRKKVEEISVQITKLKMVIGIKAYYET